jgi:membrane dipeptidase
MVKKVEERVKRLLDNSIVIDGHFDLLMDVVEKRALGRRKVIENEHLQEFLEGGVDVVVSSIFIEDKYLPEMALRKALEQISALYSEIEESFDKIMLCKSYEDIMSAKTQGKLGVMLSFEGVEPLYNDLSLLRVFYELGVRIVGLVWSRRNYAGDGCNFSETKKGKNGGITEFGVELIEEAEKLGMFIDVSHLNDEGFWDVMKFAKGPVVASHSNCRSVASAMRNLSDEQIEAIAKKNGVIGINASNLFTDDMDENSDLEHLINHVDYIVKLVGVDHVGIGFDFCDHIIEDLSQKVIEAFPRKPFDVIKGHKGIKNFTRSLIERGYSDQQIEKILGLNLLGVYKQVLKK